MYRQVKLDFTPELYLYINIPKYRVALSRLRLSSHHLRIETGRHTHPSTPPHLRICTKCTSNKVDDELHFTIECTKFQHLREPLFKKVTEIIPTFPHANSLTKFKMLLTSENLEILVAVAKFIHNAWKSD